MAIDEADDNHFPDMMYDCCYIIYFWLHITAIFPTYPLCLLYHHFLQIPANFWRHLMQQWGAESKKCSMWLWGDIYP